MILFLYRVFEYAYSVSSVCIIYTYIVYLNMRISFCFRVLNINILLQNFQMLYNYEEHLTVHIESVLLLLLLRECVCVLFIGVCNDEFVDADDDVCPCD